MWVGESEQVDHRRHVQDAAADPEQAGQEPDADAEHGAEQDARRVDMRRAVALDQRPRLSRWRRAPFGRGPQEHGRAAQHQHGAQQRIEHATLDVGGRPRADQRPGQAGERERDAGAHVDAAHPAIRDRSHGRVRAHHGERDCR
jgi:hypothetical protein